MYSGPVCECLSLSLSLAPQPTLGLGLLHKIWLNFLEDSQLLYVIVQSDKLNGIHIQ